jgi:hypothetical protein
MTTGERKEYKRFVEPDKLADEVKSGQVCGSVR